MHAGTFSGKPEGRFMLHAGGANLIFEVEAAAIEDGPTIIHLDADSMPVYSEADNFLEL
jgi:hypothetical protein